MLMAGALTAKSRAMAGKAVASTVASSWSMNMAAPTIKARVRKGGDGLAMPLGSLHPRPVQGDLAGDQACMAGGEALSKRSKQGMETMSIRLEQANRIIEAAFHKGADLKLKPLSVAVLDAGGHLIAFQRSDKASSFRLQIAMGKATGALGVGVSSRKIAEMAAERPSFVAALAQVAPQGVVPAAGGVIVLDDAGRVLCS